ncbi:16S rRNA (cytidine(1402)-2'-O)-methyltransferase [Candidatus Gottesmanbacteria bacterium]|nr:16S rRNA (cytidine(1402)-2'-O)-methyltransferase [Candidatus Gottesmanbacteria bacterium]
MGTLSIVSTPIGNLDDITIRAIKTLFSADFVACEDTRRTGFLLQELRKRFPSVLPITPKSPQLIRLDDHAELSQIPVLIDKLQQNLSVALVSDAGTPLISDPGYRLVSEALKRGIAVVSIPGPSAAVAALSISGLSANQFLFLGYPPEKISHRTKLFKNLLDMNRFLLSTYILYCAPHKLQQTLDDMRQVLGDTEIVIVRELTKIHEEVWRGTLSEALKHFSNPQGEFVLLFHLAK